MSRLGTAELKTVRDRLPDEGLVTLRHRPECNRARELVEEWIGHSHLLQRERPQVQREWTMVGIPLRRLLFDLASAKAPWPLYLWGSIGCGKTRAALAFCDRIVKSAYWTVDQLLDLTRIGAWSPQEWHRPKLAVLDELGKPRAGAGKDFDYSVVSRFVDWRESLPAIYISNHSPAAIAKTLYDTRLESRLTSGTVYELRAHDRRRRTR